MRNKPKIKRIREQTLNERAIQMLADGPISIGQLTMVALELGGHPSEAASVAEMAMPVGIEPIFSTDEQRKAYELKCRDYCMDDWPGGQAAGYLIYDSIKWKFPAETATKVVKLCRKLSRSFFFSIPPGARLVSKRLEGSSPIFSEIVDDDGREKQWDRIVAAGASGRLCDVFIG